MAPKVAALLLIFSVMGFSCSHFALAGIKRGIAIVYPGPEGILDLLPILVTLSRNYKIMIVGDPIGENFYACVGVGRPIWEFMNDAEAIWVWNGETRILPLFYPLEAMMKGRFVVLSERWPGLQRVVLELSHGKLPIFACPQGNLQRLKIIEMSKGAMAIAVVGDFSCPSFQRGILRIPRRGKGIFLFDMKGLRVLNPFAVPPDLKTEEKIEIFKRGVSLRFPRPSNWGEMSIQSKRRTWANLIMKE